MELKFSKKIKYEEKRKNFVKVRSKFNFTSLFRDIFKSEGGVEENTLWRYIFVFLLFASLFTLLIVDLSDLQIAKGKEMLSKSINNQVKIRKIPAYRGVFFDRNGNLLSQNSPSMKVYIALEHYLDSYNMIDSELLEKTSVTLGSILGDSWKNDSEEYNSISEKVYSIYKESLYFKEVLIVSDINDDIAIKIKANADLLPGVYIENGSKRSYPDGVVLSHILGYTGNVSAEDLEKLNYVDSTDVIGKTGLEQEYDERLIGTSGEMAWEVDALGRTLSKEGYVVTEPKAGDNLYLTIDINLQKKLYNIMKNGVKTYSAAGGAAIVEDVTNGEILGMVSYPSYDNNLFVGGISQKNYSKIVNDKRNPLMNRAIAAQMPPGSTFKTIVAASALDAGAITRDTRYVSRSGYTFSNGAPFQDYMNHAYGVLNLIDAISVSSNIYFCEVIRHWDMDKLVPYLEKFGIGTYTGIDVPGEAPGRLPSPANKMALANTTSPWLDPVWYPEGDSCNSVIGQGITLVTPIQMANWTSAIANGGTLNTPHLAKTFENEAKEKEDLSFDPIYKKIASSDALKTTREGMWNAVNGSRGNIHTLSGLKVQVAAKTGTAEFGKLNEKGEYENTHAWVTAFFPYDNPKYVLTIFLEDGGESINSVRMAREVVSWMIENNLISN
ncbi:penicillin-binding protein 2 [Candidatus Microgenomates bacterium]|nr:penicillin-binding protein 2 [Candidatus Microgenomates bacterium]